jgi:N-acetylglucosamine kinase-like BadF-type ATPase
MLVDVVVVVDADVPIAVVLGSDGGGGGTDAAVADSGGGAVVDGAAGGRRHSVVCPLCPRELQSTLREILVRFVDKRCQ